MDEQLKAALGAVAPAVATALGGPLAGVAATVLGRVLLGKPESAATTLQEAQEAVTRAVATPEGLAKLREAEARLLELESQLTIRLEEVAAGDRASARAREIALRDRTPMVLAVLAVTGFFGILGYMLVVGVPRGMQGSEALILMLGALGTIVAQVFNYYFGSSSGSKEKTAAIAAAATRR